MATSLNLDSLVIDSSGRASFSGLSSGIDIQSSVNALIAAKRIPIDSIEKRISNNEAKVAVLNELSGLTRNLRQAVSQLRGQVSFDGSGSIFAVKQTFTSASRADSVTPSAAATILSVTASNRAQATNHTIVVQQIATAHKIASDPISTTLNAALGESGTIEINGASVTIEASDSLLDLRDRINAANSGGNATGVAASLVSISASEQVLVLSANQTGTNAAITVSDGSGTILQNLGVLVDPGGGPQIKNQLQAAANARIEVDGLDQISGASVIERQSNTISDIMDGVTLSLFKAEPGTTIKLDIERDLNQVKSAIVNMVDAYNELRTFINTQAQAKVKNEDGELESGILAGTRVLSEIRARLADAVGSSVQGTDPTLSGLAAVGITIKGASQVGSALLANTLSINEAKLDEALLNNPDGVRKLFGMEFSSSSSNVQMIGFSSATSFDTTGYKLNIAYSGGQIISANINGLADGSDDGSITVAGDRLTVRTGGATGLQLLYKGAASASGIDLNISVGIGAQLFGATERLLDERGGVIASEVTILTGQNGLSATRVETLNERLVRERERLLNRFVAMESALSSMNTLLESIRQQADAAFGGNN